MPRALALSALVALTACGEPEPLDATLTFEATLGDVPAACGVDSPLGLSGATAQLADARFFLHGVELRDADDGTWVPLVLTDDGVWQSDGLALLDFEDGTAGCADSGNADLNDQVRGTVPEGTYDGLRFEVGVPHARNHLDSATAPAPLNAQGMFWVWATGYKFLRVDAVVSGETPSRWNVHLGSTGCTSDAPTVPPDAPCSRPNRPRITLEGLDPLAEPVRVDLAALFADAEVGVNTPETPPGCMSNPMEPDDCDGVFGALGLDFASGACVDDCAGQDVFGVE